MGEKDMDKKDTQDEDTHEFQIGDNVRFRSGGREYRGEIVCIGKRATVKCYYGEEEEIKRVPLEKLQYVPPIVLTKEQIASFCRFEDGLPDMFGYMDLSEPITSVRLQEPYTITLQDLLTAVENIEKAGKSELPCIKDWYLSISLLLESELFFESSPKGVERLDGLPDRSDRLTSIFCDILGDGLSERPFASLKAEVAAAVEKMLSNEQKPIAEREYTDEEKEHFLYSLWREEKINKASDEALTLYRQWTDELCLKDNIFALRCKADGCYGGNRAFACDWNAALDCNLRLYRLTGYPAYANTVGYIYYYGRCGGKPQYEEAFRYFSIGAAGGWYESRYKLADMYANGYYVDKNPAIAYRIVNELYDQNIGHLERGEFDCKFADIALRLGEYTEAGYRFYNDEFGEQYTPDYIDFEEAYEYYLQAEFAIGQRAKYRHYGDPTVANNIRQAIDRLLSSKKVEKPKKCAPTEAFQVLWRYLEKYRKLKMNIRQLKGGDIKITVRLASLKGEEKTPKMFITDTGTGFCGLVEKVVFRVKGGKSSVKWNEGYFDSVIEDEFYCNGKKLVTVTGDWYFCRPKSCKDDT